ncbi:MAG: tRNA dihydrouridine synthase DusB [Thermodesulfobacteriota bacterium]
MKIGNLTLRNNVIFAPLAGISNLPLRLLAKEAGCGLVCSEMVSANGLLYGSAKTLRLMESLPAEKPLSIQIFGTQPDIMAKAAGIAAAAGADVLDINMGCSVKKVVKTGAGVALMRTPDLAEKIFRAVRAAVDIPLTVKIRSGWDSSGAQAFQIAAIAQDCGVDAVILHPRTAGQGFGGKAAWSLIAAMKPRLRIPLIGNGDIVSAEDAARMLAETGCDGIMIGRGAIGNPLLFSQVLARLDGKPIPRIDLPLHFEMIFRFLDASIAYFGEVHACRIMRSRLPWFVKGFPHSAAFRESLTTASTREEIVSLINDFSRKLETGDPRNRFQGIYPSPEKSIVMQK